MGMLKAKLEEKAVLDFSKGNVSRNYIRQALRKIKIISEIETHDSIVSALRENYIQIGMFRVYINPYAVSSNKYQHLRQLGGLNIVIYERKGERHTAYWGNINEKTDKRFKEQSWVELSPNYKVRIKHLVDIIYYCHKLNKLRAFL